MYTIIKTGGKQIEAEVGQVIYAEKLDVEAGKKVVLDEVIPVGGEFIKVGTPAIAGATAEGTAGKHGRQKEVVTFRYKSKKHPHRKRGHR